MWDFNKIPKKRRSEVKTAWVGNDYKVLKKILDKYDVIVYEGCGSCNIDSVIKKWVDFLFKDANPNWINGEKWLNS